MIAICLVRVVNRLMLLFCLSCWLYVLPCFCFLCYVSFVWLFVVCLFCVCLFVIACFGCLFVCCTFLFLLLSVFP